MTEGAWVRELKAAITVCDREGVALEMNDRAAATHEKDGGRELIGRSILDCHPERARALRGAAEDRWDERLHDREGRREEADLPGAVVPGRRVPGDRRALAADSIRPAPLRRGAEVAEIWKTTRPILVEALPRLPPVVEAPHRGRRGLEGLRVRAADARDPAPPPGLPLEAHGRGPCRRRDRDDPPDDTPGHRLDRLRERRSRRDHGPRGDLPHGHRLRRSGREEARRKAGPPLRRDRTRRASSA